MRIVQIAPTIGPGSGVANVAHHLEHEWQRRGIETVRFTMAEARGDWLPEHRSGVRGKLAHLARVVWFSTVGTCLARRYLRRSPGTLSICHNDALAGDIYVNHGILEASMRARGRYLLRVVRNPVHLFTIAREKRRYGAHGPHRLVVNLTSSDDRVLHDLHPRMRTPTRVIGNGVDLDRFSPPTPEERELARRHLGLDLRNVAVLFVSHEFDRKGLPIVLEALTLLPVEFKLVVVGGTADQVARACASAVSRGLGDRVQFSGPVDDPRPFFHASDVLALPSAYETGPLVVLEALACGLPVVATATGLVPDLVRDGRNGFVVSADPRAVRRALEQLPRLPRDELARESRRAVAGRGWASIAEQYLEAVLDSRRLRTQRETG